MPREINFDKNLIYSKGIDLFIENGFNGTSVEALVQRLSLNRSSLYNSFGNKNDYYHQVISHCIKVVVESKIGGKPAVIKNLCTSKEFKLLLRAAIENGYTSVPQNEQLQRFWKRFLIDNGFSPFDTEQEYSEPNKVTIEHVLITMLFSQVFQSKI